MKVQLKKSDVMSDVFKELQKAIEDGQSFDPLFAFKPPVLVGKAQSGSRVKNGPLARLVNSSGATLYENTREAMDEIAKRVEKSRNPARRKSTFQKMTERMTESAAGIAANLTAKKNVGLQSTEDAAKRLVNENLLKNIDFFVQNIFVPGYLQAEYEEYQKTKNGTFDEFLVDTKVKVSELFEEMVDFLANPEEYIEELQVSSITKTRIKNNISGIINRLAVSLEKTTLNNPYSIDKKKKIAESESTSPYYLILQTPIFESKEEENWEKYKASVEKILLDLTASGVLQFTEDGTKAIIKGAGEEYKPLPLTKGDKPQDGTYVLIDVLLKTIDLCATENRELVSLPDTEKELLSLRELVKKFTSEALQNKVKTVTTSTSVKNAEGDVLSVSRRELETKSGIATLLDKIQKKLDMLNKEEEEVVRASTPKLAETKAATETAAETESPYEAPIYITTDIVVHLLKTPEEDMKGMLGLTDVNGNISWRPIANYEEKDGVLKALTYKDENDYTVKIAHLNANTWGKKLVDFEQNNGEKATVYEILAASEDEIKETQKYGVEFEDTPGFAYGIEGITEDGKGRKIIFEDGVDVLDHPIKTREQDTDWFAYLQEELSAHPSNRPQ